MSSNNYDGVGKRPFIKTWENCDLLTLTALKATGFTNLKNLRCSSTLAFKATWTFWTDQMNWVYPDHDHWNITWWDTLRMFSFIINPALNHCHQLCPFSDHFPPACATCLQRLIIFKLIEKELFKLMKMLVYSLSENEAFILCVCLQINLISRDFKMQTLLMMMFYAEPGCTMMMLFQILPQIMK